MLSFTGSTGSWKGQLWLVLRSAFRMVLHCPQRLPIRRARSVSTRLLRASYSCAGVSTGAAGTGTGATSAAGRLLPDTLPLPIALLPALAADAFAAAAAVAAAACSCSFCCCCAAAAALATAAALASRTAFSSVPRRSSTAAFRACTRRSSSSSSRLRTFRSTLPMVATNVRQREIQREKLPAPPLARLVYKARRLSTCTDSTWQCCAAQITTSGEPNNLRPNSPTDAAPRQIAIGLRVAPADRSAAAAGG
mmetsp:Transcript_3374/g.8569  ORF Transcript_3374/g.8569 Transcript_3374/m.8569 type:complete len:251 (-) Transcript_3374:65-817(-)